MSGLLLWTSRAAWNIAVIVLAGQADRGEAAVQKAAELHPDLVLMDIGLKGDLDGIEAAEAYSGAF